MANTAVPSETSIALVLTPREVMVVILCLVFIALVVVLQPLILSFTYRRQLNPSDSKSKNSAHSFFETPYVTWFLVHNGMAALAMIVILILGLDAVIDRTTTAALLGSLFGYVLGSSAKSTHGQDNSPGKGKGSTVNPDDPLSPETVPPSPELFTLHLTEESQLSLKELTQALHKQGLSKSEPLEP